MCIVDSHRHLIGLLKYFKRKELRLPNPDQPHGPSSKMVATIHVNQIVRLPDEVKASRETCKVYKNERGPY